MAKETSFGRKSPALYRADALRQPLGRHPALRVSRGGLLPPRHAAGFMPPSMTSSLPVT